MPDLLGPAISRRLCKLKERCSLFVAVSQFIRKKLLAQGFPDDKICVHYIGIDTRSFSPSPAVKRRPTVLFVGRLVEKKGCEYLIRAMQSVQEAAPQAELVVIGDGPLRPSLEKLATSTLRRVKFLGLQTQEQIRDWMNQASVLSAGSGTEPQRVEWMEAASEVKSNSRLGQSGVLSGFQLFAKINCTLAQFGETPVDTPPLRPQFADLAAQGLVITNTAGVVALKLTCPTDPGDELHRPQLQTGQPGR